MKILNRQLGMLNGEVLELKIASSFEKSEQALAKKNHPSQRVVWLEYVCSGWLFF